MTATATPPDTAPKGGILREWIAPIALGLVIGAGIVGAWKYGPGLLENRVEKVVARWDSEDWETNDTLAQELAKLGKDARPDLLRAFRAVEVPPDPWDEDQWKVWVGMQLASEPFFDSRSLLDICRDASAPPWDRRCAAAAVVHTLRKDADPTAVTGPLLDWLRDLVVTNHQIAFTSVRVMVDEQTFPPDRLGELRDALLALAAKSARPAAADEDEQIRVDVDRQGAVGALGRFIQEDAVVQALWKIAEDETDDSQLRSWAIQTVAAQGRFDDLEPWKRLAASPNHHVRQTVADNVVRSTRPEFDAILAALHADPEPFVRKSSIETQTSRRRATILPLIGVLVEDHEEGVREAALLALGAFKDEKEGLGQRQGIALRVLEHGDTDSEVGAAALALHEMTGQSFGFAEGSFDLRNRMVDREAVAAFRADVAHRAEDVARWREKLGPGAVWSDDDRRRALETLAQHADPANRERAAAELAKLTPR